MNTAEMIGRTIAEFIFFSGVIVILLLPIIIPITIYLIIREKNKRNKSKIQQTYITLQSAQQNTQQENSLPYHVNEFLLTNKEKSFYYALKPITDKYEYIILSKMRIADIVNVTANKEEFMKWFNKINKKHIDFIICNREFRPLLLIEIDDSTHDRPDRIERDKFIDDIFKNKHIKLIHLRQWKVEELESIIINSIVSQQTVYNLNT